MKCDQLHCNYIACFLYTIVRYYIDYFDIICTHHITINTYQQSKLSWNRFTVKSTCFIIVVQLQCTL